MTISIVFAWLLSGLRSLFLSFMLTHLFELLLDLDLEQELLLEEFESKDDFLFSLFISFFSLALLSGLFLGKNVFLSFAFLEGE